MFCRRFRLLFEEGDSYVESGGIRVQRSRRGLAALLILSIVILATSLVEAQTPTSVSEGGQPARSVSLEVDGAVLEGVTVVGALEVARPLVDATCGADGICTGELALAIDDLDAAAESLTDKARHDTAKNSIQNIRARMAGLNEALGIGDLDSDGDGLPDLVYQPGQPIYGNITLERALDTDQSLSQWWAEAAKGKSIRKSISVIIRDRGGKEVARYNFFECFPVSWSISVGDSGPVERLEVRVDRIEMARTGRSDEGQPARGSYAVGLEADGEAMGTFVLDSSLTGALTGGGGVDDDCDDTDDSCRPTSDGVDDDCDGVCTAGAVAALTALEEQVAGLQDRAKHDIAMNAIRNMKAMMPEVETNLAGARRPGRVKYGNITLKRGLNGSDGLAGWITDTVSGKPWKRSITLTILGPDGKEVARVTMQGGPVSYTLDGGTQMIEKIELAVEKVERAK